MTRQGRGSSKGSSFLFLIVEISIEARGSKSPGVLVESSQEVSAHGSPVHQVSGLRDESGARYGEALLSGVGRGVVVHWRGDMNWVMFVLVHWRGRGRRRRVMFMVDGSVVVRLVVLWLVQLRMISVGVVVVLRL